MRDMLSVRRCVLPLLVFTLSSFCHAQTAAEFAGTWVMTLANKPFLVLSIKPATDTHSVVSGYLLRPAHFQSSDGVGFSQIANKSSRRPIVRSELKNGVLSIVVQDPGDTANTDEYQLRVKDPAHLTVTVKDVPFEPRILVKAQGTVVPASDWDDKKTYSDEDVMASNAEMQRIFDADQKDRQPGMKIDWSVVGKADEQRRQQTRKLLDDGALHTGEDFEHAAFVFQHGSTPNDYLLAHTLAMVAVKKGRGAAIWIAAATLDRYLQNIKQPQIYGTQFVTPHNGSTTQEPYDRQLVSDALRRQLGVPSQAMQEQQRKQYDEEEAKTRK